MRLVACRYAVVQFAPYRETGEFANVGVVLMCPETGFFNFKLQTRKSKRVTDFFEELPREFYQRALEVMQTEFRRIANVIHDAPVHGRPDYLRQIFDSLLHPREAMMRFGPPKAVMSENPELELNKQFDHYVERAFATPEYVEQTMEKRIKSLLKTLTLVAPFQPDKVGDDTFYARFPLVQRRDDLLTKIIKPFNLNQAEPVGIFDHGDAWLQKVRRLRKRNLLPEKVLFAVAAPPVSDTKRYAAFTEICGELGATGIQTVDEAEQDRIATFALG